MADKSPRQHLTQKSSKSIKEKRADKRAKAGAKDGVEITPAERRR
jgi:hypothetical protein